MKKQAASDTEALEAGPGIPVDAKAARSPGASLPMAGVKKGQPIEAGMDDPESDLPRAIMPGMPFADEAASPMSLRKMYRWGLVLVAGNPGLFLLATALSTAVPILTLVNTKLVTSVVNALGRHDQTSERLWTLATEFVVIAISLIPLAFLSRVASVWCNTAMATQLQQVLHDRVLAKRPDWHDRHGLGDTNATVMQFAPATVELLRDLVAFPVTRGITLGTALYFLLEQIDAISTLPWWANILLLSLAVILPIGGWLLAKRTENAYQGVRAAREELNAEFINSASKPIEVQVLGAERQRANRFGMSLAKVQTLQRRASVRLETATQFNSMVPTLLTTGLLVYAVLTLASDPKAQIGSIVGIILFVPMVTGPINEVIGSFSAWVSSWPLVSKVGSLLDADAEERAITERLPDGPLGLQLDAVRFAYPGAGAPVLQDASLEFVPNKITAVVGRSGSGKSSIIGLLAGLRSPDSGSVLIGGRPVSSLLASDLRKDVAIVSQFPLFIDDSLRANFQLAKEDATDGEIIAAARQTGLWPVLEAQAARQGLEGDRVLDALMGKDAGVGAGMSGGQRRLLAVTRMLLRRPRILLLDEPMTGIDNRSIELILECLRGMRGQCTIVLIEHNMNVVRGLVDIVKCLDQGRVSDIGTPAELADRPSLFRELLEAQERIASTADMEVTSVAPPALEPPPTFARKISR